VLINTFVQKSCASGLQVMKIVTNFLMLVAPVVFLHRDVYIFFFCDNVFAYK
jgi:hypothetical protein